MNRDGLVFFKKSIDNQAEMDVNMKNQLPGTYIIKVFTKRIVKD